MVAVVVVVGCTEILRSGKKVMKCCTHTQISFPRSALLADKKWNSNSLKSHMQDCIQWNGQPTMSPKSEWHQGLYYPSASKLDHLQYTKHIFAKWISNFYQATCIISLFLHIVKWHQGVNYHGQTLGHLNWIICCPRNLYLQNDFPLY